MTLYCYKKCARDIRRNRKRSIQLLSLSIVKIDRFRVSDNNNNNNAYIRRHI